MTGNVYCIKAGFYTCCSGKGEDCKVAGEDCYCDAVCHFRNDCCDDIQQICPGSLLTYVFAIYLQNYYYRIAGIFRRGLIFTMERIR